VIVAATLAGCQITPQSERNFTVLYTNDEHGWMEGMGESNSAANLMQLWKDSEGYSATTAQDFLLLSGGDNWTGPAISTWNQGASMVELEWNNYYYFGTVPATSAPVTCVPDVHAVVVCGAPARFVTRPRERNLGWDF
jgi:hypothetical protein